MTPLECAMQRLRQANEILQKAATYFARAELDRQFKPRRGSSTSSASSTTTMAMMTNGQSAFSHARV